MHIGDLMLVTPVLRTLRTNFPKARIMLLADKKLADLVICNKHIDGCLLLDKKGADNHPLAFLRFIRRVRREHFDLVINLHRNERASALAAFSGAGRIVGYAKPLFSAFFDKVMENKKAVKHQIHSHFDVLKEAAGIERIDDDGLEMWLPEGAEERAAKLWQDAFPAGAKVIALNIGASWKTKRWIDEYFAQTADHIFRPRSQTFVLAVPRCAMAIMRCCRPSRDASRSPSLRRSSRNVRSSSRRIPAPCTSASR